WKFALGLVASIYVHEMGHVAALLKYGVRASAPMFIPGLGAVIRMKQALGDPQQEARVGLAGPAWGVGAALAAYAAFLGTGLSYEAFIASDSAPTMIPAGCRPAGERGGQGPGAAGMGRSAPS